MESKIITFASQKGGVGKSTICVHVATYLANKSHSVVIIDCDLQNSIFEYSSLLGDNKLVTIKRGNSNANELFNELNDLNGKFDFILLDTAGKLESDINGLCVEVSDLLITPFNLSSYDLLALTNYKQKIKELHPEKKHYFLMNKKKRVKEVAEFTQFMKTYNIDLFTNQLPDKRVYVREINFNNSLNETVFIGLMNEIESLIEKL